MKDRKRGKLIWATGISGCGRKEHLENWKKYCESKGKKVKIYHVGQMLFEWAKRNRIHISKKNVLRSPEPLLDAIRGAVLERIFHWIEKDLYENDAVVVCAHADFYWMERYTQAFNVSYIRQFNPDVFVCFIDSGEDILERLKGRLQWSGQNLTEKDVLLWQNVEVKDTKMFPELFGIAEEKKSFVIPVKQPVRTLFCLLFEPWRPILYIQMPITHLERGKLKKVEKFIDRLWGHFIVFNPLTIETGKVDMSCFAKEGALTRHFQTVYRDLHIFLPQCEVALAYFVDVVFTVGVIDESIEAFHTNKEVWVIFPGEYTSPFLNYRARVFKTPESFFDFVRDDFLPNFERQK